MDIIYGCLLIAIFGIANAELQNASLNTVNCSDIRVQNGPIIIPCVSEIILQKGDNYTFTCKGTSKLKFRQQNISEECTSDFKITNTSRTITEEEFNFESTLDLINVDQYAIGYYVCSDDTVLNDVANEIIKEPENGEHVSYIYVYVNGTDTLLAPMKEIVVSRCNKVIIECRPTTPDVEVSLSSDFKEHFSKQYSPKVGFMLDYDANRSTRIYGLAMFTCVSRTKDREITEYVYVKHVADPPEPKIIDINDSFNFAENETFSLNCTVKELNSIVTLSWTTPEGLQKDKDYHTYGNSDAQGCHYTSITVHNATIKHNGTYTCVSGNICTNKSLSINKSYLEKPYLTIKNETEHGLVSLSFAHIYFTVESYPKAKFKVFKDGVNLNIDNTTYVMSYNNFRKRYTFKITNAFLNDTGLYTIVAENGYPLLTQNISSFRNISGKTKVTHMNADQNCIKGKLVNFTCDVEGNPFPGVTWRLPLNGSTIPSTNIKTYLYTETAHLDNIVCEHSGDIICNASNTYRGEQNYHFKKLKLRVYEIHNGFGVNITKNNFADSDSNKTLWVLENKPATVGCIASVYEFSNVTWLKDGIHVNAVQYNTSEWSHVAELVIASFKKEDDGVYACQGVANNGTYVVDELTIKYQVGRAPVIEGGKDSQIHAPPNLEATLSCIASGVPLPDITWKKDGARLLRNDSNVKFYKEQLNTTVANYTISIERMKKENEGVYECSAKNEMSPVAVSKSYTLKRAVDVVTTNETPYLIAIGVIILALIILIVFLTMKVAKEKRFRKALADAGLLYFKEGVTNSINPERGIDEQAELLPYDEKFEFPHNKLTFGKQLGAGAFGVVFKADARGIVNAEETTPVAVKMVKKTADNMYIKALATELKIMVHLGKHVNIVNLLGACTKNVGKRELVVIVEYCKFGNIHNYLQRHREVFIDQLDTDHKDRLGKVNRAYASTTTGSSAVASDYFGSTNTQDTGHTFLNTTNTARSDRKNIPISPPVAEAKVSEGYVQPEWRSNYEGDHNYEGRAPRPLTSRDLIAWSFQIARGMEYLASRKVLHGDLAARNILLADDNVVKICDFGLARSIYRNDEYQKSENCLLPVKWLAIECMTDRIFSTQSDVWSFGIVLWEVFTLAKTPYPHLLSATGLLDFLSEGHRLNKPQFADARLYELMLKCWQTKPTQRPSFTQLQEQLGAFLEDNVRNYYVDLNSGYTDKNGNAEGQQDYLAMMCAPDYNNLVTPSPKHDYVNTNTFFPPTPVKVDIDGYLQTSPPGPRIFSPRSASTEFDFDPRKLNQKSAEAATCGSELTPMLTLDNVAAKSGSESDHEGTPPCPPCPPYPACPAVDEADDVFAPSDARTAKDVQLAVSNPTYITFDHILDKNPKHILNYVNVANGLVK